MRICWTQPSGHRPPLSRSKQNGSAGDCPFQKADDLNETGLIGDYLTPVTTTLGNLEAKRTSVNPNAAALVVHLLFEAGSDQGIELE